MSELLHFSEHALQEGALVFMAVIYTLRVRWLLKFKAGKERQASTARAEGGRGKGIAYSLFNIAMPWAMESTRQKFPFYIQFVLFHLGVVAAIGLSFIIPYAPSWLVHEELVMALQIFIGLAFLVGLMRMIRRVGNAYMRAISTPDDYFSLALLTVWFGFAFFAVPNETAGGEWHLLTYFWLTAFFLIYVPFSKISHYLYYPFTRYYLGKTMGHRGVFPLRRNGSGLPKSVTTLMAQPLPAKGEES